MQQFKEALSTFHALCLGMILLALCILKFGLIPSYAYYFVWQSTFVFLVIALFLSIYFNKSKLFVLLLFPLFFDLALAFPSTLFTKLSVTAFWHITPLITALGYLLLYALQERGLFSSFGAFRTALGLIVLGIGYLGLKYFSPSMQQALDTPILHASLHGLSKANDFILIISLISLLFIFLISLLFEVQSQKAPFWMLLAQMIPFLFLQESNSFLLFSLVTSLIAISALVHDAYRMAYADTLTGIPSRRALEERFLHLGSHYMIAMADIDFFKKFNDKFGHDIGDDVLKLVAKELSHIKNGGKAYRYGGEEFTILFNGKKKEECIMALEEVRERIFRRGFVIRDKNRPEKVPQEIQKANTVKKERLSISIGLATSSKGKAPNEIIKIADDALYKAKESGRNCLICL
ncbi:putative diguanylate cyclase [Sulfurospirillum diekertiae]|uniref:diguanylate cyclase n=1 Tax=Sulfurospirillum diekertiae TaxID=1854492 RepID=A0A290HWP5_9BACT|nr:GGDEF domain-containing protein [Sulfurospirillum diekertiae]ATB70256.1 putative diguanylate cyclase [Sulfurospirillum diekertiae]